MMIRGHGLPWGLRKSNTEYAGTSRHVAAPHCPLKTNAQTRSPTLPDAPMLQHNLLAEVCYMSVSVLMWHNAAFKTWARAPPIFDRPGRSRVKSFSKCACAHHSFQTVLGVFLPNGHGGSWSKQEYDGLPKVFHEHFDNWSAEICVSDYESVPGEKGGIIPLIQCKPEALPRTFKNRWCACTHFENDRLGRPPPLGVNMWALWPNQSVSERLVFCNNVTLPEPSHASPWRM